MDPEEDGESTGQGQNLHDLQNYLVTFNKEIEPGDDVLSNMDVDGGVGDVNDLYTASESNPLQESEEGGVAIQFSSGFYSEQGILDTALSDESAQQIQNLVAAAERDPDVHMNTTIKQEVTNMDLEGVQVQMSGFGDTQLSQTIPEMQSGAMSQSLLMTSLGDNLGANAGKVIRIVSLGDDGGQFLSLPNGQQMQILNHDDLGLSSDILTAGDSTFALSTSQALPVTSSTPEAVSCLSALTVNSASSCATTSLPIIVGRNSSTEMGSIINSTASVNANTFIDPSSTQLVALQGAGEGGQPQLVALQGDGITQEALQMSNILGSDSLNSELGYQTITIVPSELNQNGEMNYMLVMSQPDGDKDASQGMAQVFNLKQEAQEISEELIEENGETKRVLRLVPKKYLASLGTQQLTCDYCNYTSPKRYLLTRHMKSHSDIRPHKCKECDRGFKTAASLMNHENTHTGTRPHKCKTCEAAFTTSGELVRHIRYRHTFEKPHRCPNCDYASVELSKLKRHMRSHTGERPYKCPHCPYASPDTYKLKRHLRIHTGEKPYECDICHARFTQSNSLKAHKLIHTGNKPVFQCNLCPTTCGRKTDLKIHFNKLHTMGSPLECKKCGKMFSDRYSYKQHVRSHDVDKCMKCEECDFMASTDRMLEVHAASHASGKKYECEECHTVFPQKLLLDKHKAFYHGDGEDSLGGTSCKNVKSSEEGEGDSTPTTSTSKKNFSTSLTSQSKGERSAGIESSGEGSLSQLSPPLASDTLHKNLLQDIKEGKLGDVPQVVIVHPDGSLEEISSRLPGDKLNIADIFSTLSNSEKSQHEGELKDKVEDEEEEENSRSEEVSNDHSKLVLVKAAFSGENDSFGTSSAEASQCEASTQAELESDSDSLVDTQSEGSPGHKILDKSPHHMQDVQEDSQSSDVSCKRDTGEAVSLSSDTAITSVSNTSTPDQVLFLNSSTASTASTSTTDSNSLASLLQISASSSASDRDQSNPQLVLVKGCYLNEDGSQSSVMNLNKESMMKLFVSLDNTSCASTPIGAVQLLAAGAVPMDTKLVPLLGVPQNMQDNQNNSGLNGDSASQNEDNSCSKEFESTDSSSGKLGQSNLLQCDSDISSHDVSSDNLLSRGDENDLSMHCLTNTSESSTNILDPQSSSHYGNLNSPSVKVSLSSENLHAEFTAAKDSFSGEGHSNSGKEFPGLMSFSEHMDDGGLSRDSESDSPSLGSGLDVSHSYLSSHSAPSLSSMDREADFISNVSICPPQETSTKDEAGDVLDSVTSNSSPLESKQETSEFNVKQKGRRGGKRSVAADPSLVMTGKRVRKALVKVSL